jgi:PmbA protein
MPETTPTARPDADLDRLAELARDVIRRAQSRGASASEVGISVDEGLHVNVRMGEVESVEYTRDRGLSLTVYVGHRKGSASTADLNPVGIERTIDQALAIARYTGEDPANGLADPALLATEFPDLDLWHPWDLDAAAAVELARACEAAGLDLDPRIVNSEGASVSRGGGYGVYANSLGFLGRECGTHHSYSCSLIAEDGEDMQRDDDYSSARRAVDLDAPAAVGRRAAERALRRLKPAKLGTRRAPVLYDAPIARSLIGHLLNAISGGAQYRKSSFLLDRLGQTVIAPSITLIEDPWLPRGPGSAAFDEEGVQTRRSVLVESGVLTRYLLGSYSARRLGLTSTGNAGGVRNLGVSPTGGDLTAQLKALGTGLYVTELMGQGVNGLTGDYSRGAAGFWVESGQIAYPVDEVTIAGNLKDMLMQIASVGTDIDPRGNVRCGSILLESMTIAGS